VSSREKVDNAFNQRFRKSLNRIPAAQECDATMLNSSNAAKVINKKIPLIARLIFSPFTIDYSRLTPSSAKALPASFSAFVKMQNRLRHQQLDDRNST
jgi:hypothetical protein